MTIDERIQALAERTQAIAESVELLTADVHRLQKSVADLKDAALALLAIAGQHERRIHGLEGNPQ